MSGGKELLALNGIAAGAVGLGVAQLMAVPFGRPIPSARWAPLLST
jgi:type IV secretory pathway TrbD component